MTGAIPPSGDQFTITHGDQRAVVVEVGGGVREYTDGGRPVLDPYPVDALCDGAHGTPLIPWPNRLADGRYRFDGVDYEVPLTEPAKGNAIHGFLRWRPWQATRGRTNAVTMRTQLPPQPGYPFRLDVEVRYELSDDGLTVTTTAANLATAAAPYGFGQHPYLSPGHGRIDDAGLELHAGTRITTDPHRQLPTGTEPVAGTEFDFGTPRKLEATSTDFAFTDLHRDAGGLAWVRLRGPDGATAELWADDSLPYLALYTGDTLAPGRRRRGLGVEPMTCPPNAFQTREHLVRLEPGASKTVRWGVRLRR